MARARARERLSGPAIRFAIGLGPAQEALDGRLRGRVGEVHRARSAAGDLPVARTINALRAITRRRGAPEAVKATVNGADRGQVELMRLERESEGVQRGAFVFPS